MGDPALEDRVSLALASGDHRRAATLAIEGYGPQLLGYLTTVLRDETLAADAFAELCEDLWRGLQDFRGECTVRTFSYKLARHAALRLLRDPFRRRGKRLDTDDASDLADRVRSATSPHLRTAIKDKLSELRATLEEEEQTLLILRLDRELSWQEVAEVLGVDEAAARKRFERTKERLRELMAAQGLL